MTVTWKTGEPVFSDEGNLAIHADPLLTANAAQEIKIFVYKFGGLINMFIFAMQSLLMFANIATAVCPTDVIASNLIATTNAHYILNFRFSFDEALIYYQAGIWLLLLLNFLPKRHEIGIAELLQVLLCLFFGRRTIPWAPHFLLPTGMQVCKVYQDVSILKQKCQDCYSSPGR